MKVHAMLGSAVVIALVAGAGAVSAAEGDPAAGQTKNSMCAGCHGIPGYKASFPKVYSVPKLGGQNAAYIVKALQAYKSGERDNATMKAIAAQLSDKDMADLAAYYTAPAQWTANK